jgi:hypothetical protein
MREEFMFKKAVCSQILEVLLKSKDLWKLHRTTVKTKKTKTFKPYSENYF